MKCPNCNSDIEDGWKICPSCGARLTRAFDDPTDPKLGWPMRIFLLVGTIAILVGGFWYYGLHKNDPEYFRTQIDPDSSLADKYELRFDTVKRDTVRTDSVNKMEREKAKEIYNSIRRNKVIVEEAAKETQNEPAVEPESETPAPSVESPSAPTPPAPKVESLD